MPNDVPRTGHAVTRRRTLLLGAVATVVAVGGYYQFRAPTHDDGHLSVQDAYAQARDGTIVLIDIRQPEEWRQTGIPETAHAIDMRRADFAEALRDALGPDTSRPVALICARGVRSARMSRRLKAAGFENILDVPEGMLGSAAGPGWLASRLPTRRFDGATG